MNIKGYIQETEGILRIVGEPDSPVETVNCRDEFEKAGFLMVPNKKDIIQECL